MIIGLLQSVIFEVFRACGAIMLIEPIWVESHALLNQARGGEPPVFAPAHPWVATVINEALPLTN